MSRIEGMTLLIFRVKDVEREVAFYRDGLGLAVTRHVEGRVAQFALPLCGALELAAGGEVVPLAKDRTEVPAVPVFRVANVHEAVEQAVRHGARVVNAPFRVNEQWVAYVADPEGHVVGLASALAP
ncbi:MAG: hypothetical protein KatS3mg061_0049 [Dehalococcoidia bacterium]|nr:MAG: hypothetical protein KatS3mg061_0049 [Dehalococcoidia bacterium]